MWDESLPGFGARVRALSTRFVIQYRVGGRNAPRILGDIRRISLVDARKIARDDFASRARKGPGRTKARAKAAAVAQRQSSVLRPITTWRSNSTRCARQRTEPRRAITRGTGGPCATDRSPPSLGRSWPGPSRDHPCRGRVCAARARGALSTLFGWAMSGGFRNDPAAATNDPAKGIKPREESLATTKSGRFGARAWRTISAGLSSCCCSAAAGARRSAA